jgi:hypothetical protein
MGNSSSKTKKPYVPLVPVSVPLGKDVFYTQHTSELALRVHENRPGKEYAVQNIPNLQTIFWVKKVKNQTIQKVIQDAKGEPLFEIEKKTFFNRSYTGTDAKTKARSFKVKIRGRKIMVTLQNLIGNGEQIELSLKGDLVRTLI